MPRNWLKTILVFATMLAASSFAVASASSPSPVDHCHAIHHCSASGRPTDVSGLYIRITDSSHKAALVNWHDFCKDPFLGLGRNGAYMVRPGVVHRVPINVKHPSYCRVSARGIVQTGTISVFITATHW